MKQYDTLILEFSGFKSLAHEITEKLNINAEDGYRLISTFVIGATTYAVIERDVPESAAITATATTSIIERERGRKDISN